MRCTGVDVLGDLPWGTHFCQFYEDKQDLIDILVPYFVAGLERNEFCMWVTCEPLGVEEAKAALSEALGDLDPYLCAGQLEVLDSRQWYTAGGTFEADRVMQGWVEKLVDAQQSGCSRTKSETRWRDSGAWLSWSK